jgi:hypothetical protein
MPIRPPKAEELPKLKMLAYGSSITHGACSMVFSNSYISRMARRLGVDVLNKGMGGSCFCEKEVAEYISTVNWDFAVLELAVNMIDLYTPLEFEKRAGYVIEKALERKKTVVFISHFTHFRDHPNENKKQFELNLEFRKASDKIKKQYKCDDLLFIDGRNIVDYKMLTCDLIHPSIYGHSVMGDKIANILIENSIGDRI